VDINMTAKTLLLLAMQLAASGADAYYTDRNAQYNDFREFNPIAQSCVRSRGARIAYFSATAGIKIAAPRWLRHRHHDRLAQWTEIGGIVDSAASASISAACGR
jgi:hypothetical protein